MRVLTLFLRFGTQQYARALEDVDDLFRRQIPSADRRTIIIDNALPEATVEECGPGRTLIGGDNSFWEFSGWDRGIRHVGNAILDYDLVHLVTSAFRTLYTRYLDLFDLAMLASIANRPAAVGHIDYYGQPISLGTYRSQHWMRTSFLFLPPTELMALGTLVGVRDRTAFFSGDPAGPFRPDAPLSANYRRYIEGWLTGEGTGQGVTWHSRFDLSAEKLHYFEDKALTILNEHMFGIRLRALGCRLVDATWLATALRQKATLREIPGWRVQLAERGVDAVSPTSWRADERRSPDPPPPGVA